MKSGSESDHTGVTLALVSGLGLLAFAVLWELRWRRLAGMLSMQQRSTERWAERALHDSLTNLPNRSLLQDRMEQALFRAQRNQTCVAVLFIDLDDFKRVNDVYGHQVGDRLLVATGERLQQHLRASDTASRLGGDEFVVLLEMKSPNDPVMMVAERLRRSLHVPLLLEPEPITVSASIGVALSKTGTETPEQLLNAADQALYDAKQSGKNRVLISAEGEQSSTGARQAAT